VQALLDSATHYVEARWRIASLEGREALRAGAAMAVLAMVIVLSLAVAYAGLMAALAWWLAHVSQAGAGAVMAALALGHLALAVACALWLARSVRNRRLFHATRKEFMEDRKWLEAHHPSRS